MKINQVFTIHGFSWIGNQLEIFLEGHDTRPNIRLNLDQVPKRIPRYSDLNLKRLHCTFEIQTLDPASPAEFFPWGYAAVSLMTAEIYDGSTALSQSALASETGCHVRKMMRVDTTPVHGWDTPVFRFEFPIDTHVYKALRRKLVRNTFCLVSAEIKK